jgi:hypothetical protein
MCIEKGQTVKINETFFYLCRFCLNVKFRNHELDGAALHEYGDKDDEQGGGEEDVLEDSALVKNGHQRKSNSASQTSVGKNKLLLKKNIIRKNIKNIKSKISN